MIVVSIRDFLEKLKTIGEILKDVFLVAVDVVRLYQSIAENGGLEVLFGSSAINSKWLLLKIS